MVRSLFYALAKSQRTHLRYLTKIVGWKITEFDVIYGGSWAVQKRPFVNKLLPVLDEFESGTDQQKFNLATDIINQVEALHETENGVMVRGRYVYNL